MTVNSRKKWQEASRKLEKAQLEMQKAQIELEKARDGVYACRRTNERP